MLDNVGGVVAGIITFVLLLLTPKNAFADISVIVLGRVIVPIELQPDIKLGGTVLLGNGVFEKSKSPVNDEQPLNWNPP